MSNEGDPLFWLRWVLANALSEAIGLGAVLLIGFSLLSRLEQAGGMWPILLAAAAGALLGIFEGVVVGGAQGTVLRRRLPGLTLRRWITATVIGAVIAWTLGLIPSTAMNLASAGAESAPMEMPEWVTYLLAMGMGLVLGVVLAVAQWPALRPWVRRAWLWLPANAVAWLVGMPIVFLGMGLIPADASLFQAALTVLVATAATGAVVGAIHGLVLVKVLLPGKGVKP